MVRAKGRYLHFTQWSSKIHTWKTKMKLYIIKDLFPVHCQTVLSQFHVLPEDGTRIRNQEFRGKFGVTRRRARCSVVAEIADFSYIPHIHITKPLFVHKSHHLQPISTLKHMYEAHISYYKSWVHLHTHTHTHMWNVWIICKNAHVHAHTIVSEPERRDQPINSEMS